MTWDSNDRRITATIKINNTDFSDNLKDFSITESIGNGNGLTLGTCNSSSLELHLICTTYSDIKNIKKSDTVEVSLTLKDETEITEKLGTFYISEISISQNNADANKCLVDINANDAFSKLDGKYFTWLGTSTGDDHYEYISSIMNYIYEEYGLEYEEREWSEELRVNLNNVDNNATVREVIGYLACIQGGCAYINERNKISCDFLGKGSPSTTISRDKQYIGEFSYTTSETIDAGEDEEGAPLTAEREPVRIKTVEISNGSHIWEYTPISSDPNVVTVGDKISAYNPLVRSETTLSGIWSRMDTRGTVYNPFTVKWRGNPTIRLMDGIKVETPDESTVNGYVMEKKTEFDGSLVETISCYRPADMDFSTESSVTDTSDGSAKKMFEEFVFQVMPLKVVDSTPSTDGSEACEVTIIQFSEKKVMVWIRGGALSSSSKWTIPLPHLRVPSSSNGYTNNLFFIPPTLYEMSSGSQVFTSFNPDNDWFNYLNLKLNNFNFNSEIPNTYTYGSKLDITLKSGTSSSITGFNVGFYGLINPTGTLFDQPVSSALMHDNNLYTDSYGYHYYPYEP